MANFSISIDDYSEEVLQALSEQVETALETCGLVAEGYAKLNCPVDTGNLRNSITHMVEDRTAIIGTNVENGLYNDRNESVRGKREKPGAAIALRFCSPG